MERRREGQRKEGNQPYSLLTHSNKTELTSHWMMSLPQTGLKGNQEMSHPILCPISLLTLPWTLRMMDFLGLPP